MSKKQIAYVAMVFVILGCFVLAGAIVFKSINDVNVNKEKSSDITTFSSTVSTPIPLPTKALIYVEEYIQKYPLSCEAAATSAAMRSLGFKVTEDQVLQNLLFDQTPREVDASGNIKWGDPYAGFVGDYKGIFHKTGYGVYAPPIADAVKNLGGKADSYQQLTLPEAYMLLNENKLLIVWVPTRFEEETVNYWTTPSGKKIPWIQHEHAMVLRGYDTSTNTVYLMDVYTGKYQTRSVGEFIRGWGYLDNQAVAIYK